MAAVFAVSHFIALHPLVSIVSALSRYHGNLGCLTNIHLQPLTFVIKLGRPGPSPSPDIHMVESCIVGSMVSFPLKKAVISSSDWWRGVCVCDLSRFLRFYFSFLSIAFEVSLRKHIKHSNSIYDNYRNFGNSLTNFHYIGHKRTDTNLWFLRCVNSDRVHLTSVILKKNKLTLIFYASVLLLM